MSLPTQHSTSVDPEFCESQRRRGLFRTEDLRFEDFSQDEKEMQRGKQVPVGRNKITTACLTIG